MTPSPAPPELGLSAGSFEGIATPLGISVKDGAANRDPGQAEEIEVHVVSGAEPAGETVKLRESGADTGTFEAEVALERVYDEAGAARSLAANGAIAVYAEATATQDTVTVKYGALEKVATYAEPPSTVAGMVKAGEQPVAGALVELQPVEAGDARQTLSRADGSYAFHDVQSGDYMIMVVARNTRQYNGSVTVP